MTTDANNHDNNTSGTDDSGAQNVAPECAPGCACEKPVGKGTAMIKVAVCLIVLVAVGGILLFYMTSAKQNNVAMANNGFPGALSARMVVQI